MEDDPSKPETTFYALWRKWRPAVKIVVIESLFALAAGVGRAEAASATDANYGVVIMRRFKRRPRLAWRDTTEPLVN